MKKKPNKNKVTREPRIAFEGTCRSESLHRRPHLWGRSWGDERLSILAIQGEIDKVFQAGDSSWDKGVHESFAG